MARATQSESFPWILAGDTQLIGHKEGEAVKVMAVSELICYSAQKFGIMQVNVTDHDLQQKTTESCSKVKLVAFTERFNLRIDSFFVKWYLSICQDILDMILFVTCRLHLRTVAMRETLDSPFL